MLKDGSRKVNVGSEQTSSPLLNISLDHSVGCQMLLHGVKTRDINKVNEPDPPKSKLLTLLGE